MECSRSTILVGSWNKLQQSKIETMTAAMAVEVHSTRPAGVDSAVDMFSTTSIKEREGGGGCASTVIASEFEGDLDDGMGQTGRSAYSYSDSRASTSASLKNFGSCSLSVGTAPSITSSAAAVCAPSAYFFEDHKPLKCDLSRKVTKYAHRRLHHSKLATPCQRAVDMLQLHHSQITLDKFLGEGSFSIVYSVSHLNHTKDECEQHEGQDDADNTGTGTGSPTDTTSSTKLKNLPAPKDLVVKILRKKLLNNPPMLAACAADLVKEGLILARLNHENILPVHAWSPNGIDAFSMGRHDAFFLILGKLDTTLSDKLKEWRRFKSESGTWNIFQNTYTLKAKLANFVERLDILQVLAKTVVYLHSQNILHRDLKPDNIGFDASGTLKVFDFDVARLLPSTHSSNPQATFKMTKRVGSPR